MSELKFASTKQALQYLADLSGCRVAVTKGDKAVEVNKNIAEVAPELAGEIKAALDKFKRDQAKADELKEKIQKLIGEELASESSAAAKAASKSLKDLGKKVAKIKDETIEMQSIILEFEDAVVERLEKVSSQPKYKEAFEKACQKVNEATRTILQEAVNSCYNISDSVNVKEKSASVKTAGILEDIIQWGKNMAKKFVEALGVINQGQNELETLTTDLLAA